MRIKPHPQGTDDNCFGSSVIIGPAAPSKRPFAEIVSANYVSSQDLLELDYKDGSSAILQVVEINRTHTVVKVTFTSSATVPLVTFRSMFVALGNSDVDHVGWKDAKGVVHDDLITAFTSGESTSWFFHRDQFSTHNTSSPDIRIGQ
ncbi:MAG: hypothetical protein Q7S37_02060 [bacterium]|nr:hypothetical protein [bacterium]